jgi:hypothetical protein
LEIARGDAIFGHAKKNSWRAAEFPAGAKGHAEIVAQTVAEFAKNSDERRNAGILGEFRYETRRAAYVNLCESP